LDALHDTGFLEVLLSQKKSISQVFEKAGVNYNNNNNNNYYYYYHCYYLTVQQQKLNGNQQNNEKQ